MMLVSGDRSKSEWESLNLDISLKSPSVCDFWKENTHKIIKKAEYQTPTFFQNLKEIQAEFLHGMDTFLASSFLLQRKYFDKLGFDEKTILEYGKWCDTMTSEISSFMDVFAQYSKMHSDGIINSTKIVNTIFHQYLDWQAKLTSSIRT